MTESVSTWRRCEAGHIWNHATSADEHAKLHGGQGFTPVPIDEPTLDTADVFTPVLDYIANVPDDIPWVAEPFAYFGGVTILAGIWKGGKSTLVSELLRARESAETFLGRAIDNGPCLLITEEGGIPVKRKVLGMTQLSILDRRAATALKLDFDAVLTQIKAYCLSVAPARVVVVIDTFAVWGDIEDENDAVQATAAISKLTTLAQDAHAAIVLVHHVRKDGGSHGRGIRGSSALPSTVDIFAELDYADGGSPTDRTLKLEGRVIMPMTLRLTFDTDTMHYGVVNEADAAQTEADIWTNGFPITGDGLTTADLAGRWELGRMAAQRRAAKLIKLGRMRKAPAKIGNADGFRYWQRAPEPVFLFRERPESDG